jgi:hypothetical protein
LRLAERHRLTPRKKKKRPSSVKLRRKSDGGEPTVLYISKSTYSESSIPKNESSEEMLGRINESFSLKIKDDLDQILSEIFKRGWKVPFIELSSGRRHVIRFYREVGGVKSRPMSKKDESLKKVLLKALEHVLYHESNRYNDRMGKNKQSQSGK